MFNPGASIPARVKRISIGDFDHPTWELSMARKDARLMIEETERPAVRLNVIPAIAKDMDRWIDQGHGADDWTVIAKDAITH